MSSGIEKVEGGKWGNCLWGRPRVPRSHALRFMPSLCAGGCASCRPWCFALNQATRAPCWRAPGRQLTVAALRCHHPWPAYSRVKWSLFRTLFDERRSNGLGTPGLNQTWARMAFSQIVRLLGFEQTLCSAHSSGCGAGNPGWSPLPGRKSIHTTMPAIGLLCQFMGK